MYAVILAGGKGTRLRPYTTVFPKPLVPIGGQMPILEVIVRQLAACGFKHITITVNHLAELIMAFFSNGERWGVTIEYSRESKPLSTIGPLTLLDDLPENFLVMNGDILCDLDYRYFYDYHCANGNSVTVATYQRETLIDFGVLDYDSERRIDKFIEKPVYHFDVSMGIYCIQRQIIANIPRGEKYGFDDLMRDGIANGADYRVMPFSGFWLDIGRPEDYDYCNENFASIKEKLGL